MTGDIAEDCPTFAIRAFIDIGIGAGIRKGSQGKEKQT
jgi:hypothetical protein